MNYDVSQIVLGHLLRRTQRECIAAMLGIFDIYFFEALLNGVLLGGVFALLALGLNLVFGVIDVVWICYSGLVMLGVYGMYFLYVTYHVPFLLAAVVCVAGVGVLGVVLHIVVIQ